MIFLLLKDFSYNSHILVKYLRSNHLKTYDFIEKDFNQYMALNYDLNDYMSYNIFLSDTIKTSLSKNQVISNGSLKILEQLSLILNYKINDTKCIDVIGMPLFKNPQEFVKKNGVIEYPVSVIHKNLVLCKKINYFRPDDVLNTILDVMNKKYGIPLITATDKKQFIEYLRAS